MLGSTILIVSDDKDLVGSVSQAVRAIRDLQVAVVPDLSLATSVESWDRVALVLVHLDPGVSTSDVLGLLRSISESSRAVATLVVADQIEPEQGLILMRQGVADYLSRPLNLARIAYLADVLTVRSRDAARAWATEDPRGLLDDRGGTESVEEDETLMAQVRRVAPQDATILLSGETGTGKTRLARQIHELSSRRSEPFLTVHCGSMTAGQVEAELFGHVRGAMAGPDLDRPCKFAEVGRGTLFLDEVDALPMSVQSKLLRVVEDRELEIPGTSRPVPIQARLIAASNRELEHEVAAQRFRSDLYYRLNVIGFRLAPLRQRRASIPALASKFLAESTAMLGHPVHSIAPAAIRALMAYDWPGNIRELKNTIERTVALGRGGLIQPGDLPEAILRGDSPILKAANSFAPVGVATPLGLPAATLAEIKRDAEFARITEALHKHSNNRLRAASELGISRMTLYKKLYKYGLMQPNSGSRLGSD